jgi:hypothetical protein
MDEGENHRRQIAKKAEGREVKDKLLRWNYFQKPKNYEADKQKEKDLGIAKWQ